MKYCYIIGLLFCVVSGIAMAQDMQLVKTTANEYERVDTFLINGVLAERVTIKGPPNPPPGYTPIPVTPPGLFSGRGDVSLPVPTFNWCFGCSATSGAMMAAYYDRNSYDNMYTGPTNGGVMPMDNSSWPDWFDGTDNRHQCPLSATHDGLDGRVGRGNVDDYWVVYNDPGPDPYVTNGWIEHTWGDCTADFMKTSRADSGNSDGATTFWYASDGSKVTPAVLQSWGALDRDGGYGLKLFYESRGYQVNEMFNQHILGHASPTVGFSYDQYKAEIDAGHPVMIHLQGHTIVGVGYNDDTSNQMYIHDTWNFSTHAMEWGGQYSGMDHKSVTVVRLAEHSDLSTLFSSDQSCGGATFDINPSKSIAFTGIDVNVDNAGATATVDVYYKTGSSVGFENTPGAWTLLASGTGTSVGTDNPTHMDLPDAVNVTFQSGLTYGVYVDVTSYPTTNCRCTNGGATVYSKQFCSLSLTSNSTQVSPAFSGSLGSGIWNGTLHFTTVGMVPEEYGAIQTAIDAAMDGGVVSVGPNTYTENIDFKGKAIKVFSRSGAASTIIDGNSAGAVVTLGSGEGPDSILDGFTLTNGSASNGAGVYVGGGSSPIIRNNIIRNNTASGSGGGMYINNATPSVSNNTIHDNTATNNGGGIYITNCSPVINHATIYNNSAGNWAGGIAVLFDSNPVVANCTLYGNTGNYGGGMRIYSNCTVSMVNTSMYNNDATQVSGDALSISTNSSVVARNTIIWGNASPYGIVAYSGCTLDYDYCDFGSIYTGLGNIVPGANNIVSDPKWNDPINGDFHLASDSPCIDVGDNSAANLPSEDMDGEDRIIDGGVAGAVVDMGSDEYNPPTLVQLAAFKADGSVSQRKVIVMWETASEIDNAGFHVWRKAHNETKFKRITRTLIPAQGGPTWGAEYILKDSSPLPGARYQYQLEDISFNGTNVFHDPVEVHWRR